MIDVLVVVYRPDVDELGAALDALAAARADGVDLRVHLWHNDDGPVATPGVEAACARLRARRVPLAVGGGRGNLGFGGGVNALLAGVGAEHVLLLNQDAIPEPGALARLWQVACGDAHDVAAWEMRQIPYEHPKDYDPVTLDTGWCSGAAVLLRTRALREVGGFEPRIFMYGEDVDLSWRLRCAGWRLRYLPRCAVVHRTYAAPNEVKPLQVLGSVYANLALRTRFAGRRCVAQGVAMVLRELKGPQPFGGRRRGIVKALVRFALNYRYFRRTREAGSGFAPCFNGWDFEPRREGAFHPFRAAAEQAQPRPSVSLVVHCAGEPARLRRLLTNLEHQTHRPLELVVVEVGTRHGATACEAAADRLALRHLALAAGTTRAEAMDRAVGLAGGEWLGFVDDDRHLLYADHVEVLLQAALDAGAAAAYGLVWRSRAASDAIGPGGLDDPQREAWPVEPFDREALRRRPLFPLQAALIRRELYARHGGWPDDVADTQARALWARCADEPAGFVLVPRQTSIARATATPAPHATDGRSASPPPRS